MEKTFPFSCPVCARLTDYPFSTMVEGAVLICSCCKFSLRLHGHMLEYVQKEMEKQKKTVAESGIQEAR